MKLKLMVLFFAASFGLVNANANTCIEQLSSSTNNSDYFSSVFKINHSELMSVVEAMKSFGAKSNQQTKKHLLQELNESIGEPGRPASSFSKMSDYLKLVRMQRYANAKLFETIISQNSQAILVYSLSRILATEHASSRIINLAREVLLKKSRVGRDRRISTLLTEASLELRGLKHLITLIESVEGRFQQSYFSEMLKDLEAYSKGISELLVVAEPIGSGGSLSFVGKIKLVKIADEMSVQISNLEKSLSFGFKTNTLLQLILARENFQVPEGLEAQEVFIFEIMKSSLDEWDGALLDAIQTIEGFTAN